MQAVRASRSSSLFVSFLALAIAGLAPACSGPAESPGSDAGHDAAALPDTGGGGDDAHVDTGVDGGADTGVDGGIEPDSSVGTCGDAIRAVGSEACDDGNEIDGDGCGADCTVVELGYTCPAEGGVCTAACGDAVRAVGAEECDDGNTMDGDGCSADCAVVEPGYSCAPEGGSCTSSCGDAVLAVGAEVCDDGNTMAGDGCTAACTIESGYTCPPAGGGCTPIVARRVFVSSAAYTGALGGVAGADGQCQTLANAASLGGTWRAWLSDSSSSPSTRFAHASVPYVRIDGTMVATDWAGLTSGSLLASISVDEHGTVVAGAEVWTATITDGSSAGAGCNDFTSGSSAAPFAYVGLSDRTDSTWTGVYLQFCDRVVRLYCFEQ